MLTDTLSELARRNLVGLGREALAAEMAEFGAEPFRARQLWHWIYRRGATDFTATSSRRAMYCSGRRYRRRSLRSTEPANGSYALPMARRSRPFISPRKIAG